MRANIGKAQRKRLAHKTTRRAKRAAMVPHYQDSERSKIKRLRQDAYLDQVGLDKLNGLEIGRICRKSYKDAKPKQKPQRQKRKAQPREADTYRGVRRNSERGTRRAVALKAERLQSGETRSQADRRRFMAAQAA